MYKSLFLLLLLGSAQAAWSSSVFREMHSQPASKLDVAFLRLEANIEEYDRLKDDQEVPIWGKPLWSEVKYDGDNSRMVMISVVVQ